MLFLALVKHFVLTALINKFCSYLPIKILVCHENCKLKQQIAARGINVGGVGVWHTPQTYVSVGLQMSAVGLKI